jgi:hypothetical protein
MALIRKRTMECINTFSEQNCGVLENGTYVYLCVSLLTPPVADLSWSRGCVLSRGVAPRRLSHRPTFHSFLEAIDLKMTPLHQSGGGRRNRNTLHTTVGNFKSVRR